MKPQPLSIDYEMTFWEPEPLPPIPERSQICPVTPIQVGGSQVECFTSSLSRLADGHGLTVGSMFNWGNISTAPRCIAQKLVPFPDLTAKSSKDVRDCSYALNGFGPCVEPWIIALEQLTLQKGLEFLTLIPYRNLLGETGLLRKHRAWCSQCYQSDEEEGRPTYDRLAWCLKVVSRCSIHHTRLKDKCPNCNKTAIHLSGNILPGYCHFCEMWLGDWTVLPEESEGRFGFEAYAAISIGRLLEADRRDASHLFGREHHRNVFANNLEICIGHFANGNNAAFAKSTGISYQTLRTWLSSLVAPTLETILKLGFELNIFADKLLLSNPLPPADLKGTKAEFAKEVRRRRPKQEVRTIMAGELRSAQCRSLRDLASSLGYKSDGTLYGVDSKLASRITKQHRAETSKPRSHVLLNFEKRDSAEIEAALQAALAQDLPPTVEDIGVALGCNRSTVEAGFRDLCFAITAKRRVWKKTQHEQFRKVLVAAILEDPPPDIGGLVKKIGGSCTPFLLRREKDLVVQLERAIAVNLRKTKANIGGQLELALREPGAPTFRAIAKRLGITESMLRWLYPEQVKAITARARLSRSEELRRGREAWDEEASENAKD